MGVEGECRMNPETDGPMEQQSEVPGQYVAGRPAEPDPGVEGAPPQAPPHGPTWGQGAPPKAAHAGSPQGGPRAKGRWRSGLLGTVIEIVVIVVAAFAIALLVQAFLIKPFTIHQVSMRPTLQEGDRILLNRLVYHFRQPARGDIIVFHSPINADEDLVKRIVGVAGDRIAVTGGKLWVNGVAQDEPYLLEQDFSGEMAEIVVPDGDVFVMGDNRNNSGDSRLFGPIPTKVIIGSALVVYWPISHWRTL
jgi:signal peptidase I